jgi:DNA-binding MarR family transcriptional regulator
MFERRSASPLTLKLLEGEVLRFIRSKSRTEKKISRELRIDPLILSPVVTDLILKGYLEIYRRRWMYFFTREMCTITSEGVLALQRARSPFRAILEMVQKSALETIDTLAAESPALRIVAMSVKTIYKVVKVVA